MTCTTACNNAWWLSGLLLSRARRTRDPVQAAELVRQAHEESEQALADLREVAWRVYPTVLDHLGLRDVIGRSRRALQHPRPSALRPAGASTRRIETVAYFVISEALTNAAKHSNATPDRHHPDPTRCRTDGHSHGADHRDRRRPRRRRPERTRTHRPGRPSSGRRRTSLTHHGSTRRTDDDPSGVPMRVILAEDSTLLAKGRARCSSRRATRSRRPSATATRWSPLSKRRRQRHAARRGRASTYGCHQPTPTKASAPR